MSGLNIWNLFIPPSFFPFFSLLFHSEFQARSAHIWTTEHERGNWPVRVVSEHNTTQPNVTFDNLTYRKNTPPESWLTYIYSIWGRVAQLASMCCMGAQYTTAKYYPTFTYLTEQEQCLSLSSQSWWIWGWSVQLASMCCIGDQCTTAKHDLKLTHRTGILLSSSHD